MSQLHVSPTLADTLISYRTAFNTLNTARTEAQNALADKRNAEQECSRIIDVLKRHVPNFGEYLVEVDGTVFRIDYSLDNFRVHKVTLNRLADDEPQQHDQGQSKES